MAIIKVELLKLGRRIKASRKTLGRKQKDFCERCGLERSHFDEIERGERNVTFSNLCQICDGLNCDIAAVTEGIPHLKSASKKQTEDDKHLVSPVVDRSSNKDGAENQNQP
jgi:transcriptional regulator with XRE-family HTH domain